MMNELFFQLISVIYFCAAGALLVVEAHRGHVAEDNSLETTDVDANFHRGRYTQHVDLIDVVHDWTPFIASQVNCDVSE